MSRILKSAGDATMAAFPFLHANAATRRLVARRLRPSDFDDLCAMHRDRLVMATLGGVRSPAKTRTFLAANLAHWERHGFGLWTFRHRVDGRFVGRGGLRRVMIHQRPEVEVAYALMPEFWGQGLASEIAELSADVAFARFGLADIVAFTLPGNAASRRVMEKAGFRYERDIVGAGLSHVLYRRRRTP